MDNSVDPKTRVLQCLHGIPKGKVATYGDLAQQAGLGKAARFVATVLRQLPKDTQLPWHRVVGAGGKISIPEHHPGHKIQIQRLQEEDVSFRGNKVDMKTHQL